MATVHDQALKCLAENPRGYETPTDICSALSHENEMTVRESLKQLAVSGLCYRRPNGQYVITKAGCAHLETGEDWRPPRADAPKEAPATGEARKGAEMKPDDSGGATGELISVSTDMTKAELVEIARDLGISPTGMTKADLVEAIEIETGQFDTSDVD